MHDTLYRPIQHILVKQQAYLGQRVSSWGLTTPGNVPAYADAKS